MPPTTYGLLAIHPSHRITSPDPARAWRYDMPEACTLCHTDRTVAWAASETARQYGKAAPAGAPNDPAFRCAESVRALFAGDVVQRAVAIHSLTQEPSYTADPAARLWAVPFLLLSLEDRYPAIRHFAFRGLLALCRRAQIAVPATREASRLPEFDYLAEAPERAAVIAAWWAWWKALDKSAIARPGPAVPLDQDLMPDRAQVAALTARQNRDVVAIGE